MSIAERIAEWGSPIPGNQEELYQDILATAQALREKLETLKQ